MHQHNALVSVIIPTFNRRASLNRAINSVLAQTHPNIELIVIDDGSTDDTFLHVSAHYPHITVKKQSNRGVSAARNHGIKISCGDWLAFLDSDDAWHPDKLSQQLLLLHDNPSEAICHTNERWYRHGKFVNPKHKHQKSGGDLFSRALEMCIISPSSIVIHRSILESVGVFDESLPACEDYDLWLRICAYYKVLYLEQELTYKYGGHPDQLSTKYWGMDRFRIYAIDKLLKQGQLTQIQQQAAISALKQKIAIYLIGAKKRAKQQDINYYEALYAHYA